MVDVILYPSVLWVTPKSHHANTIYYRQDLGEDLQHTNSDAQTLLTDSEALLNDALTQGEGTFNNFANQAANTLTQFASNAADTATGAAAGTGAGRRFQQDAGTLADDTNTVVQDVSAVTGDLAQDFADGTTAVAGNIGQVTNQVGQMMGQMMGAMNGGAAAPAAARRMQRFN